MKKMKLWQHAALGAWFFLCACASYQASSVPAPVSPASSSLRPPTPETGKNTTPPQTTLEPRVGVHKPSDDTRINSGAGNAEPMDQ
jgi:hypothetical protein